MASAANESWKHHFVPQSLLRYFTTLEGDEFIYAFDKRLERAFRTSLMNAGSQNGYNALNKGEESINFEPDFDEVDALLATLLREIHATGMDALRTLDQREQWADLVAVQLLRAPIVRTTMQEVAKGLLASTSSMVGAEAGIPIPSDNYTKISARRMFHERAKLQRLLAERDFMLFEPIDKATFRISDRPVMLSNSNPYGDTGLASQGVTVFMPLGQCLMLGILCPSLRHRLAKRPIEALVLPENGAARLASLRDALLTGSVAAIDAEEVGRMNAHQVTHASRFIYGPTDEFADVAALLTSTPTAREVRSSIHVGEIGRGPGPRRTMPLGSWLVLFGQADSYMLEVVSANEGEPLEVSVANVAALEAALSDGPFSEMQFFVDQTQHRSMRDVKLVASGDDPRKVQVRHANPALDELMGRIADGR